MKGRLYVEEEATLCSGKYPGLPSRAPHPYRGLDKMASSSEMLGKETSPKTAEDLEVIKCSSSVHLSASVPACSALHCLLASQVFSASAL